MCCSKLIGWSTVDKVSSSLRLSGANNVVDLRASGFARKEKEIALADRGDECVARVLASPAAFGAETTVFVV